MAGDEMVVADGTQLREMHVAERARGIFMDLSSITNAMMTNWPIWFVTVTLIVAAWIDGRELKVPNWITFPMIALGWIYSGVAFGWEGIGYSLLGTIVGLVLLLPPYLIGGMGAGFENKAHACG